MDNWFLREAAFKLSFQQIRSVKYIITAFSANEDDIEDPAYYEVKEEIDKKCNGISNQIKKQDEKIKDIQRMINKIMKK